MAQDHWIAVDWGRTRLRAWIVSADSAQLLHSDDGAANLSQSGFEPALLKLVEPHLVQPVTQVLVCGAAGERNAWHEAGYQPVPCTPPGFTNARTVPTADKRLQVHVLSGISQSKPADVMRGEEAQIAGFLAQFPDYDGILCLTGTHTKWAHISAGEIVSFQTAMTGELFALLRTQSALKDCIGEGWDAAQFDTAIDEARARPEAVASKLFQLRAETLLNGLSPDVARARLSGLLIGLELASTRPYWLGQQVSLIGDTDINAAYSAALASQGMSAEQHNGDDMALAGLRAAHAQMRA